MGSPGNHTVGTYLAARLEQAGIRDYFAVPGDFNLILLDQLLANPRLRMVGCCNELNAGYAAEGYARSNGVSALVVTFGVGGLSALNAVACAYAEDLPVLCIIGGVNSGSRQGGRIIHHALGEVRYDYQREIYAHVTAGAYSIDRPGDAPGIIDRAIATALQRRKPVMIEIACDIASKPVPPPPPRSFDGRQPSDPAALADAVERATSILGGAARAVLVAGSKLRRPGAIEAFRALADASGFAVASIPAGKGVFPEAHPSFAGLYWGPVSWPGVQEAVESADACLFAGTLLSDYATAGWAVAVDPSKLILAMPEEIRMPGASFAGVDLAEFLAALAGKVRRNDASLRHFRAAQSDPVEVEPAPEGSTLTIAEVARQIRSHLGPGSALIVETGDAWFHGLDTRLPEGAAFEIQFQAGSIGWSVPATLGYELGSREPVRVIALIGDGSFQLTAQEVSTMIRLGTRPILVVSNNASYVIEEAIHGGPYNQIKNWDYAALMAAFTNGEGRGLGLKAATPGELADRFRLALAHDGPTLIEVAIDPKDCSPKLRDWGRRVAAANAASPA